MTNSIWKDGVEVTGDLGEGSFRGVPGVEVGTQIGSSEEMEETKSRQLE